MSRRIPLLVICGATGSGKSALAMDLAAHYPLEIVSADSRQVYRLMNIGTAKPSPADQARVPHHLIDLIDPDQEFSVAAFVDQARPVIQAIHARGGLPCVVGGTGLYIQALTGGLADVPTGDAGLRHALHLREHREGKGALHRELYRHDPQAAAAIHPHNLIRTVRALEVCLLTGRTFSELKAEHEFSDTPYRVLKLALDYPRSELYRRIDDRTGRMLESGLIDEVRSLVDRFSVDLKSLQTLGYREVLSYLQGAYTAEGMIDEIRKRTRQYAKKQLTWFRKDPELIWVDSTMNSARVRDYIDNFI